MCSARLAHASANSGDGARRPTGGLRGRASGPALRGGGRAARRSLEANGLGPDYRLPGLPHRTGHGIGMDVHEGPYLVRGDRTPLDVGMCFSNEPMICVPGEFGIRLEDHFYMTKEGPRWFATEPVHRRSLRPRRLIRPNDNAARGKARTRASACGAAISPASPAKSPAPTSGSCGSR